MHPTDAAGPRTPFQERTYRRLVRSHLHAEQVVVQQTDLGIYSSVPVAAEARAAVLALRGYLEGYIQRFPDFQQTLRPWPDDPLAPPLVREMIDASRRAAVGPMAAVAGALAEAVGRRLRRRSPEIVVENGGDIYFEIQRPLTVAVFAGASPLSLKIGVRIQPDQGLRAICSSSGSVGHSLSLGRADAVCVLSDNCALADAVATATGNRVRSAADIQAAVDWARHIQGVRGVLVVVGRAMGAWGELETLPLRP